MHWQGFTGFPPLEGEEIGDYMERYNAHRAQFKPWEREAPPAPPREDLRLPYREDME